ncbi:conserved Plasmodium protein, unknown function, partial [Plasmodium malariae]
VTTGINLTYDDTNNDRTTNDENEPFHNDVYLDNSGIHINNKEGGIGSILKENKSLKYCAQNILLLGTYLEHDKLKNMNIQDIYNIIDTYISKNKLEIDEIKEKLKVESEKELTRVKNDLCTIHAIKKELASIKIIEEENGCINAAEYMIREMKKIQKLKKQKEYIICLKNSLIKLDQAKKCAVSGKYDETLIIILDIVKVLHVFKKNMKEQIIKGIKFFIPLLSEYYLNRTELLLSSIYWGNNITHVSTNALEELTNNIDHCSDDEYSSYLDHEDFGLKDVNSIGYGVNLHSNRKDSLSRDRGTNMLNCSMSYKEKAFKEKIKNTTIFDNTYISLIKKESPEFMSILISWNIIEKIDNHIRDEKKHSKKFFLHKKNSPVVYIDELASSIIKFFRSFFQDDKSPLLKFDKPEWGLKYLFYQSIISGSIIKMLMRCVNKEDLQDNMILHRALQDMILYNNKYKNVKAKDSDQTGYNSSRIGSSSNIYMPHNSQPNISLPSSDSMPSGENDRIG